MSIVLTVTEAARREILDMRKVETDPDALALRVEVVGATGTEFTYDLTFEPVANAGEGDEVDTSTELPVLVPAGSVDDLAGATLDHVEPTGLIIRNPNRPRPKVITHEELELVGTVEEKITLLLDGEINPSLAVHGGFAQLERVEGDTAYVIMGGGCQGCGLAALTLTEGIKAQIENRIPEIREVVDVTDHAAGANPFYEATAK
ncbi:MAG TPA: NifU family protein [Acidimicrobiales bacterium]|nr:NifU family protein [Acidimicrobiales bacterium]